MADPHEQLERLKASHEMGKTMHESLDLDQILGTIAAQVIDRKIFRSLMTCAANTASIALARTLGLPTR